MTKKYIKITLFSMTFLFITAVLGYFVYYKFWFFITSTNPKGDSLASPDISTIEINFNKDVDPSIANNIIIQPYLQIKTEVIGKKLIIKPQEKLRVNNEYEISLYNIWSKDKKKISYYKFKFKSNYRNFNQLSKKEQQEAISQTDNITDNDPLLSSLPYENDNYKIDYIFEGDSIDNIKYSITIYPILNRESEVEQYNQQLREYKKQALDFIQSKGKDPAKLNITYDPQEAKDL